MGDDLSGNTGDDIVLGDHGRVTYAAAASCGSRASRIGVGGADTIRGNVGEDVLVGGAFGDRIDGGSERDLVFGDNVVLTAASATASPTPARFMGGVIHARSTFGNDYIAGGADDDQIFGQLGNDTIQGDGSIDLTTVAGGADAVLPTARRRRGLGGTDVARRTTATTTSRATAATT